MKQLLKLAVIVLIIKWSMPAWAVPSFARQTGLSCNVCHYDPPELTAFGRAFKLNGYTLVSNKEKHTIGNGKSLQLLNNLPLAVMMLVSDTAVKTKIPDTQNNTLQFPAQLSLFLAGSMAPHFGIFAQVTYDHPDDHFGMDNTDIRYARTTKLNDKSLAWGIDINNNPTVEDLWNSTPAWGFPYIGSEQAPGSIAAPVIDGGLGQDVAGMGAYAMYNNHLYGDFTLYRSEHAGNPAPSDGTCCDYNISNAAPYWRFAYQGYAGKTYFELGTYGMYMQSFPGSVSGPTDNYTDPAFDFTIQRPFGSNALTMHGTYIHESSTMTATYDQGGVAMPDHTLDEGRIDATYYWGDKYNLTGQYFALAGSNDPVLYAPDPIDGSRTGSPNTSGYVFQGSYWPVQNIDVTMAYTGYSHFNGSGVNYDGSGRNASDNNSVYAAVWFNY